jgi:hypothetical protein
MGGGGFAGGCHHDKGEFGRCTGSSVICLVVPLQVMLAGESFLAHPTLETVGLVIVVCAGMKVAIVPSVEGAHTMGTGIHLLSFDIVMGFKVCLPIVLPGECPWAPGASIWSVSGTSPHVGYW